MKPITILAAAFVGAFLAACGGSQESNTTTFTYPSESMEPTISYHEQVTANLNAYKRAAPAAGDIVAFHPSRGANMGACGAHHPQSQPCPKATSGLVSSEIFMKRIVAEPGDTVSIRNGLPIVNGKAAQTRMIQKCAPGDLDELCELPKAITIPPGHYFVMGDHSGVSVDSRFWGPIPRAAIFGKLED